MAAMMINVKSSGGSKYELELPSLSETVGAFKVRLAQLCDVPATSQRLIFRGHVLKDAQTFEDIKAKHGLESGQTMHMVRGAPPSASPAAGGGGATGAGVRSTSSGTQTTAAGAGAAPGAGGGALGGLGGMGGMGGFGAGGGLPGMMQNPEQMRAMMDSPFMESIFQNPEIARSMMMANPQLRQLIENNPEIGHVFNDPATFRQMIDLARNPSLMQEMMRNTDRQMANIEMMPGGFDALRRMQQDIQEPLMEAVQNMNPSTDGASNNAAGTDGNANANPFSSLFQNTPSNAPMPNPWAPNNGTAPSQNGTATAPASTTPSAAPAGTAPLQPDMSFLFGGGAPGGGGMGGMPNMPNIPPEQLTAMMDNPMMRQLMESMASDPAMLDAMINANPQLRQMADANPQVAAMLRNPDLMRTMLNPDMVRSMMQMRSAMTGAGGSLGTVPPSGTTATPATGTTTTPAANTANPAGTGAAPGAAPGTGAPDMAGLLAMMNAMGMGGAAGGAAAAPQQPEMTTEQLEELYASQLQQLRDMGFLDTNMCIQALRRANGNVHAAVENLLNQLGG